MSHKSHKNRDRHNDRNTSNGQRPSSLNNQNRNVANDSNLQKEKVENTEPKPADDQTQNESTAPETPAPIVNIDAATQVIGEQIPAVVSEEEDANRQEIEIENTNDDDETEQEQELKNGESVAEGVSPDTKPVIEESADISEKAEPSLTLPEIPIATPIVAEQRPPIIADTQSQTSDLPDLSDPKTHQQVFNPTKDDLEGKGLQRVMHKSDVDKFNHSIAGMGKTFAGAFSKHLQEVEFSESEDDRGERGDNEDRYQQASSYPHMRVVREGESDNGNDTGLNSENERHVAHVVDSILHNEPSNNPVQRLSNIADVLQRKLEEKQDRSNKTKKALLIAAGVSFVVFGTVVAIYMFKKRSTQVAGQLPTQPMTGISQ